MDPNKKRILVIEDDMEMGSLLRDFIEEEGYEVDSAGNGAEAFRKVTVQVFDLIISDIRMPGLSGLDILPGLKKIQPRSSIIVITAFGNEKVYRRAMERGADAYLEKPIRVSELKSLVNHMISAKEEVG